jgi:hypothetical protein
MPKCNKTAARKDELAVHCAAGGSVSDWAKKVGVNERTAYRLYADPAVKKAIAKHRAEIVQQAIGRLSIRSTWAIDGITKLARDSTSDSVKLGAFRELLGQLVNLSNWAEIEKRLIHLEQLYAARLGASDISAGEDEGDDD